MVNLYAYIARFYTKRFVESESFLLRRSLDNISIPIFYHFVYFKIFLNDEDGKSLCSLKISAHKYEILLNN